MAGNMQLKGIRKKEKKKHNSVEIFCIIKFKVFVCVEKFGRQPKVILYRQDSKCGRADSKGTKE